MHQYPRKAVQAVAQNVTFLGFGGVSRIFPILESMGGMMESIVLVVLHVTVLHAQQIPARWEERIETWRPSEVCIL